MATLQKIRNKAGLLVSIFIGFALLAFILGDLLRSGNSMFAQSQNTVAEIAGKTIPIQSYQSRIDENIENYKRNTGQSSLDQATMDNLQNQTWEQIVRESLMDDQFEELGIGLSGEELFDMVQGNNIDPQIRQIPIFKNQETGMFDRNLVVQFLKNMELDPSGNAKASWTSFEAALSDQKINEKYYTLISKGLFVTSSDAKTESANKNYKVDFDYIKVAFNTVSDSSISITNSDIENYYAKNKEDYKQDESREINYIVFPITASSDDEEATKEWLVDLKNDFSEIENNEQFVNLNSDVPYSGKYLSEQELSESIQGLFSESEGTIVGPYKENNAYKLTKVSSFKNIPDSVQARHILIRPSQTLSIEAAKAQADSLLTVIKKGGKFADLAKQYSSDGSAEAGGDLGWFTEGAMVGPFNDACFFGKKGDLTVVESQFGIHLIEITGQAKASKKIQLATIERNIEPSSKTYQNIYSTASKFGGSNRTLEAFVSTAEKEGYTLRYATLKKDDKKVANLESPRQLVKWAYGASSSEVSDIFEFGDNYVIATLKKVREEGYAEISDVKEDIERKVKNEKKAEYLVAEFNAVKEGANTLQAIANKLNTTVGEAKSTNFSAYSIPGLGFEPEVQGYVAVAEKDAISSPIKGKTGVYVLQVKNIMTAENIPFEMEQTSMARAMQGRVTYQVFNAIKEATDIDDRRSNFY